MPQGHAVLLCSAYGTFGFGCCVLKECYMELLLRGAAASYCAGLVLSGVVAPGTLKMPNFRASYQAGGGYICRDLPYQPLRVQCCFFNSRSPTHIAASCSKASGHTRCYDDMHTPNLNILHLRAQTFVTDCAPQIGPGLLQTGDLLGTALWLCLSTMAGSMQPAAAWVQSLRCACSSIHSHF